MGLRTFDALLDKLGAAVMGEDPNVASATLAFFAATLCDKFRIDRAEFVKTFENVGDTRPN